jgi:hypothetical protein
MSVSRGSAVQARIEVDKRQRRIDSIEQLIAETTAWEQQRNAAAARIKWMFTTEKARAKMGRAYPKAQANSG